MTDLQKRTYELLKQVPRGRVTTYKALADGLGTKAYRAIGQFMRNNPYAPDVPCHRVVSSSGNIGGFKGKISGSEIHQKIALLSKEGVTVVGRKVQHFESVVFSFPLPRQLH